MLRIPNFTLSNYSTLMEAPYSSHDTTDWLDRRDLCEVLLPNYIITYRDVDARELGTYLADTPPVGDASLGDDTISAARLLEHTKLACPTLWTCEYFFRNLKDGTHGGIDIILPQGTPIPTLTDGTVIRIKQRDGNTQNEGNCVIIKSDDDYVVSYEHLEQIDVTAGQHLNQGERIGTCGSTGNSTQYHLHLQVDQPEAPFHPYRSEQQDSMMRQTVDPLPYLRSVSPISPFVDLPTISPYNESILKLHQAGIVKGHNRHVYPDNALQRYETALLIDRILLTYAFYDQLPTITPDFMPYHDVGVADPELTLALERLQKHGVMKGHNNKFYPHDPLKGEELIALLGRVFYGLQDSHTTPWWRPYEEKFVNEHLIPEDRDYLEQPIPRKEVFLLLYWLLVRTGHLST